VQPEGFIAIAPDLLSGKTGEETAKYGSVDLVRKAVSALPREQVAADIKAVATYAEHLPAANGTIAVTGFCWGGAQTWLAMTTDPHFKAGLVFYGTADASALDLEKIQAPIFGFYGEKDARVTSTVADTTTRMEKAKKSYTAKIYPEAGHGFMRVGEEPGTNGPNKNARDEAWATLI
jgi:carboxymethylenebutenolidase